MLGWDRLVRMLISLRAVLGIPSSSKSILMDFTATISPVLISLPLQTLPQEPSPKRSSFYMLPLPRYLECMELLELKLSICMYLNQLFIQSRSYFNPLLNEASHFDALLLLDQYSQTQIKLYHDQSMSTFPEILLRSARSDSLSRPSKIGGLFSIYLNASRYVSPSHSSSLQTSSSLNKTYRTDVGSRYGAKPIQDSRVDKTFRSSKSMGRKPNFHTRNNNSEESVVIQERGGILIEQMQQQKAEEAGSFKSIRKEVLESLILLEKSLAKCKSEASSIQTQFQQLQSRTMNNLNEIAATFKQQSAKLYKDYRASKKLATSDLKIVMEQTEVLTEDVSCMKEHLFQFQGRFKFMAQQFR